MNLISTILSELKPFVYVVGSYARGEQHLLSDIDLYIKRRTEQELEENGYYNGEGEEHYIDEVIKCFEKHNVEWDSVIIGHIASTSLSTMIEASYLYNVNESDEGLKINPITLFGVEMQSTIDVYRKIK